MLPAPFDLSKLSDAVKYDVVNKTEYDVLVQNAIATSRFVKKKKIDYDYKINEINAKYVVLLAYLLLLILITLKIKYPALLI